MARKARKEQLAALDLIENGRRWEPGEGFSLVETDTVDVMSAFWSRDGVDVVAHRNIKIDGQVRHELFRISEFGTVKKV